MYRMAEQAIGCSLAQAAEDDIYFDYLSEASQKGKPALHVVYINTSLWTKARAHNIMPTITCTSSNVVDTVLQVLGPCSVDAFPSHAAPVAKFGTWFTWAELSSTSQRPYPMQACCSC